MKITLSHGNYPRPIKPPYDFPILAQPMSQYRTAVPAPVFLFFSERHMMVLSAHRGSSWEIGVLLEDPPVRLSDLAYCEGSVEFTQCA